MAGALLLAGLLCCPWCMHKGKAAVGFAGLAKGGGKGVRAT